MEMKQRAYVYLVASLLIGSFTPALLVMTKGTSMIELFLLASLISIPFSLILVAKNGRIGQMASMLRNKKSLFYLAFAGLLTYVPYEYGIAYAEHFISASLATALFRLNPLLMLPFLAIILREKLSKKQILALALAFAGILIGVSSGGVSNIMGNSSTPIIVLVVLLAFGYALAAVIIKWKMFDTDVYLSVSAFVLTLFYAILFIGSGAHFVTLNSTDVLIILYLAVTNIFSFYMYVHALKVLKTTIVTNASLLSPFFTFVWAYVLYADKITVYYLAIAALAGVGILVQKSDKLGGSYAPKKHSNNAHQLTIFDVTGAFSGSNQSKIGDVINSGGRVFAAKLDRSHSHHVALMAYDPEFTNVYTGNEASLAEEAGFVKDMLGVGGNEFVVIKAGPASENEKFFEDLGHKISVKGEGLPLQQLFQ
jgi:chloramphenicol-sensitive protein RarD